MKKPNFHHLNKHNNFNAQKNENGKVKYPENYDFSNLFSSESTVIIDGVFEYCEDIRPLLAHTRRLLMDGREIEVIFGYDDGLWLWKDDDFTEVLFAAGIYCETVSQNKNIHRFKLRCSYYEYDSFLEENSLPQKDFKILLVTTEHSDYRVTGGIGSYVKECDVLYGPDAAILMLDYSEFVDIQTISNHRWLTLQYFMDSERLEAIDKSNYDTLPDMVLEAMQSIVCLYPDIEIVESQEMLLASLVQAKKLGLIQTKARLVTVCHGSSFHLAKARRYVIDAENIHVAYKEKYTIDNSDITVFPTTFLKESYRESGLTNLDDESRIIRRLPFDYSRLPQGKTLKKYKRLIYIGKTSTIKGFDLFLGALIRMYSKSPDLFADISEIVVIATSTKIIETYLQDMYRYVESVLPIRMVSLPREELLKTLADYAEDSLALVTYRGDNHPLAVLELMAIGHDFIAANAAGTPELIPEQFKSDFLAGADEDSFSDAVQKALQTCSKRSKRILELTNFYKNQQIEINGLYSIETMLKTPMIKQPLVPHNTSENISVFIVDTGDSEKLKLTRESLKNQIRKPNQTKVIKNLDDITIPENGKVMCLYAGDTLFHNALKLMEDTFRIRENVAVVFGFEYAPTYKGAEDLGIKEFHPVPPQLGSVFLQEKYGRRFVGLFDIRYFHNDHLSDWQKSIKASCEGGLIQVVPEIISKLSYQKDYPKKDVIADTNALVSSFTALPLFDAYMLHSELKRLDDIYWGQQLLNHLNDTFIRRDIAEKIYGMPPLAKHFVESYRRIVPVTVRSFIFRFFRKIYSIKNRV